MTIYLVSFTEAGAEIEERVSVFLRETGAVVVPFAKYPIKDMKPLDGLDGFTSEAFEKSDAVIFIGALGIAVRSVATFIKSKDKDPAGIVIDDTGEYVIPFLSGHLGGANELAGAIADFLGSRCVVTTATDRRGVFAVDSWAKNSGLSLLDTPLIKKVSAALLKGQTVGFVSDFPVRGSLPMGLTEDLSRDIGISVSFDTEKRPFANTLRLVPKDVCLGVGCKKGTDGAVFEETIDHFLQANNIIWQRVLSISSVDLKGEEACLIALSHKKRIPFTVYSPKALADVPGEFSSSEFVKKTVGVDNVCERSAVLSSQSPLSVKKYSADGVTVAASFKSFVCEF